MSPNPAFRKMYPGETHENPYIAPDDKPVEQFALGLFPVLFVAFCAFVIFISIFQYFEQTSNRIEIKKNNVGQWERVK